MCSHKNGFGITIEKDNGLFLQECTPCGSDKSDTVYGVPEKIGAGKIQVQYPHNLIDLYSIDAFFYNPQVIKLSFNEPFVTFSVCLGTDNSDTTSHDSQLAAYHEKGESILTYHESAAEWNLELPQGRITRIVLLMSRMLFDRFIDDQGFRNRLLPDNIINRNSGSPYQIKTGLSPITPYLVKEIMSCSYDGFVKRLFVEAKLREIASLQLAEFFSGEDAAKKSFLKHEDIGRILIARDILVSQIINPPAIVELAVESGINEFKLKKGFKEVFGTTVFGYLREVRLNHAKSLIESGTMSVIEVALSVGYSNPGYFASLFRKKYGVNPGDYLNSIRSGHVF